eukprot:4254008-Pyramimonas_sp.AAC.1
MVPRALSGRRALTAPRPRPQIRSPEPELKPRLGKTVTVLRLPSFRIRHTRRRHVNNTSLKTRDTSCAKRSSRASALPNRG